MTKSLKELKGKSIIEEIEESASNKTGNDSDFSVLMTYVAKELYEKWGNDQKRGKGY
ncbi:MAG: hypothetical protein GY804_02655 [Alphaproteobacteria bacterium]|nr:hypothetical protein [Alphaproteobacteria bacterium]